MHRVIYGDTTYFLRNKEIDSGLFDNFKECKNNEAVFLNLHEKSFRIILLGFNSVNIEELSEDEILDLYQGLKYFMVSEDFLKKFKEKACRNKALIKKIQTEVENMYLELGNIPCFNIEECENFSVEFFEKAIENNDIRYWRLLFLNNSLPSEFFEKIIKSRGKKINGLLFSWLCTNPNLKIEKFIDYFNTEDLCRNPNLPIEFAERMIKECKPINWHGLCKNPNIPFEFFERMIKEGKPVNWYGLCQNPNLPIEFAERMIKECKSVNWYGLYKNPNIPFEFVERMIREGKVVDLNDLCLNPNIPFEFVERMIREGKHISQSSLCQNLNLPIDFAERIENEFYNWYNLCQNPNLPVEFFEKAIKDRKPVVWESLCKNPNIPLSFFKRHKLMPIKYIIKATILQDYFL
jgi:hypothetical protein